MPNDHKRASLTRMEEIEQNLQGIMQAIREQYTIFGDFDRRLTALARAKLDPEVFAQFMLEGAANKEYMSKLNQFIDVKLKSQPGGDGVDASGTVNGDSPVAGSAR